MTCLYIVTLPDKALLHGLYYIYGIMFTLLPIKKEQCFNVSCDWFITAAVTAYVCCESEVECSVFGIGISLPSSTFKILLLHSPELQMVIILLKLKTYFFTFSQKLTFFSLTPFFCSEA